MATLNLANDQLYLDGLVSVTKEDRVTLALSTINNCYIDDIVIDEKSPTLGIYCGYLSRIHSATEILIGDYITYNGNSYVAIDSTLPFLGDPYQCVLLNLNFYRFNDTVNHYRPNWIKDNYGTDTLQGYTLVSPPISCRIQPRTAEPDEIGFKHILRTSYDIFILHNLTNIVKGDILESAAGKKYKIVSWDNKESITDLMVIRCESNWENS